MDVRLPNGQVIRNVPEGTTQAEIIKKSVAAGLAKAEDFYNADYNVGEAIQAQNQQAFQQIASELSPVEKFSIGARETIRTASGRINEALGLSGAFGDPEQYAREREATQAVTGPFAFAGRVAPIVAGTGRFGATLPKAVASGTVSGALTADDPVEGAIMGGVGGGVGYGVGAGIGRMANSMAGRFAERTIQGTDDTAKALREAQRLGFRFTPGTASGSKTMQQFDAAMTSNPVTRTAYSALEEHNSRLLNHYTAKAIGVNADDLGPSTLAAADDFLSQQFDDVARMVRGIDVDGLQDDIINTIKRPNETKAYLDELATGKISGRTYMDLRSKLLAITRGSSDRGDDAWNLIDQLDESVGKVAPPGYKEAYAAARERYKVLLALDKYANGIKGGDARAVSLNNALRRIFGKSYTRARTSNVPEVDNFLKSVRGLAEPRTQAPFGNSGTTDRFLPWAILAGLAYDPTMTAAALTGGAAAAARGAVGAASPTGAQIGSAVGRTLPQITD